MDINDIILALNEAQRQFGLLLPPIIRIDTGLIYLDDGTFLSIEDLMRDALAENGEG